MSHDGAVRYRRDYCADVGDVALLYFANIHAEYDMALPISSLIFANRSLLFELLSRYSLL